LEKGDDETDKQSGKKEPSGLPGLLVLQFIASGPYDAVDSLLQEIWNLKRHL
jgi:hypothetical protein